MGLYISNMEMPAGCAFCKIKRRNGRKMVCPLCDGEWDIHDPMSADFRLQNCPLVPVPEHGRLIDADALIADVRAHSESYFADDFAHEWVDVAPTIIPAEEGET